MSSGEPLPPDDRRRGPPLRSRPAFLRVAAWSYVMDGGQQALSLVFSFVLAAMLGPRVYGVVALATIYILFVQLVQRHGLAAALIQREQLNREHQDTAFWLATGLSLAMTGLSAGLAGWWADVSNLPELAPVLVVLSLLVPIEGLIAVHDALLRRRLDFRRLALRSLVAATAGGVAGMAGALADWGVWALVAQQLVTGVTSLVVLWSVSGWRPGLRFSGRAARDLLGFSTGSFLSSVAVFVNNRSDTLLIGLFFGPVVAGIYRLAGRLVDLLYSAAIRPVQTLALPELSRHQRDPGEFTRQLTRLMRLSALIALPALGLLAGVAEPLIAVLGPEWGAAAPALRILCVVGAVRVAIALDGPMLQAAGAPFAQAVVSGLAAAASVAAFAGAGVLMHDLPAATQVVGMAAAVALFYTLVVGGLHALVVGRYTALSLRLVTRAYAGPLAVGLVTAVAGAAAGQSAAGAGLVRQAAVSVAAAVLAALASSWLMVAEFRIVARAVAALLPRS